MKSVVVSLGGSRSIFNHVSIENDPTSSEGLSKIYDNMNNTKIIQKIYIHNI